jgi:hypothetical protein
LAATTGGGAPVTDESLTRIEPCLLDDTSSEDAAGLATEVLRRGEVSRGEAAAITGRSERTGRAAVAALIRAELLVSDTPKGPVRLRFSAAGQL